MEGSCHNLALAAQLYELATFLEFSGSLGKLKLTQGRRNKSNTLQKDEFLVYAAFYGLSGFVLEALVKRKIGGELLSDILAISERIASEINLDQDDIALVDDLLDRGADPNYKGYTQLVNVFRNYWPIESPISMHLTGNLQKKWYSRTKLTIQRVCHVVDGLLRHGANTLDLVNINVRILKSGEVSFFSIRDLVWYRPKKYRAEEEEEEDEEHGDTRDIPKICILLVPAFILIDILVYQLEEATFKTGHSQEKCCNLEHINSIRVKARPIDTATGPRIIALNNETSYYRVVSDEDSAYLSDAVVKVLTNRQQEDDIAMLGDRYLEVYWRSKRRSNIYDLLVDEGLFRKI